MRHSLLSTVPREFVTSPERPARREQGAKSGVWWTQATDEQCSSRRAGRPGLGVNLRGTVLSICPWAVAACLAVLGSACSDPAPFELPKGGPGVIFSFPFDGQWDVPTGSRIVLSFTDPVDTAVVQSLASGSST